MLRNLNDKNIFWKHIIFPKYLVEKYKKEIELLLRGQYTTFIHLEKLINYDIYSIRVIKDASQIHQNDRLFFVEVPKNNINYFVLAKEALNHKDNHRELAKVEKLKRDLQNSNEPFPDAYVELTIEDFPETSEKNEEREELGSIIFFNHKAIALNKVQERALELNGRPRLMTGMPGTGKSCVAMALLTQFVASEEMDDNDLCLYITQNLKLIDEMGSLWRDSPLSKTAKGQKSVFMTFDQLIFHLFDLSNFLLADETHCKEWLANFVKIENIDKFYQEFRLLSGYDEKTYLSLGKKQSSIQNKKWIRELYVQYLSHLAQQKRVHPAFFKFFELERVPYKLIIVDEAQDFSTQQLYQLLKLSRGNICFNMDSHQSLTDYRSQRPYLLNLTVATPQGKVKIQHIKLPYAYRCAKNIVEIAEAILKMKFYLTGGLADKYEQSNFILQKDCGEGKVNWEVLPVNKKNKNKEAADRKAIIEKYNHPSPDTIIITTVKDKAFALSCFDKCASRIFTIDQVKGLEYDHVILFQILNNDVFKEANKELADFQLIESDHINRPKEEKGEQYRLPFNKWFTAGTRARIELTIMEIEDNHSIIHQHLKKIIANQTASVESPINNTKKSWLQEAEILFNKGLIDKSKAIYHTELTEEEKIIFDRYVENENEKKKLNAPPAYKPYVTETKKATPAPRKLSQKTTVNTPVKKEESKTKTIIKKSSYNNQSFFNTTRDVVDKNKEKIKKTSPLINKQITPIQEKKFSTPEDYLEDLLVDEAKDFYSRVEKMLLTFAETNNLKKDPVTYIFKLKMKRNKKTLYENLVDNLYVENNEASLENLKEIVFDNDELIPLLFNVSTFQIKVENCNLFHSLLVNDLQFLNFLYGIDDSLIHFVSDLALPIADINMAFNEAIQKGCFHIFTFLHKKYAHGNPKNNTIALMSAIFNRQKKIIKYLLEEGIDITHRDQRGWTILHHAISIGDLPTTQYFIEEKNMDVNIRNDNGSTPILFACSYGHLPILQYLLKRPGIDIEATDNYGNNVLHCACSVKQDKVVKYLLNKKIFTAINAVNKNNATPLLIAANQDNESVIKCLFAQRGIKLDVIDNGGNTAFHYAVQNNFLAIVKYFIRKKIDVNIVNAAGAHALILAVYCGHEALTTFLLDNTHIHINAQNDLGDTALHYAASKNHVDILKNLINHHANVNIVNKNKENVLMLALFKGHLEIAEYIINNTNIDINAQGLHGGTVLHVVIEKNYFHIAKLLINKKIDINLVDDEKQTALMYATIHKRYDIAEYLINQPEIKLTILNKSGISVTKHALITGEILILQYIIARWQRILHSSKNLDRDLEIYNKSIFFKLMDAFRYRQLEIINYLFPLYIEKINFIVKDQILALIMETMLSRVLVNDNKVAFIKSLLAIREVDLLLTTKVPVGEVNYVTCKDDIKEQVAQIIAGKNMENWLMELNPIQLADIIGIQEITHLLNEYQQERHANTQKISQKPM